MLNFIRFSLISFLLLSSSILYAQRALYKPQTHEVGIQLGAANFIPALSEYYGSTPMTLEPLSGLAYTYHYSISDGFRLRFTRKTAEYMNSVGASPLKADLNDWDARLGYMRKYHKGANQVYAGAEIIYRLGKVYEYPLGNTRPENAIDDFTHMGAAVFAGYRYYFNTHLSASFELGGYYSRSVNATSEPIEPGNVFRLPNGEAGLEASVSLNFHFVKMKSAVLVLR